MIAMLLTTAEACELLHVSRSTLQRLATRGEITPLHWSANRTLYRSADLDRWLAAHEVHSDAHTAQAALELLAEAHAAEERDLCPACGRRRVNRGQSVCTYCAQADDLQLSHKRRWWDEHGAERRAAAKGKDTE